MTINQSLSNNYSDDWLGKIPANWSKTKFKALFRASNERVKDYPDIQTLLSVSGYTGIQPKNIESLEGQMPSEDVSEYRIVRKGQLVVNTMWLNYAGLGISDYDGYVSPAYRSYYLNNQNLNKKFIHYLLRSPLYIQKYSSLLYGIRPNSLQVKTYDFERIQVLLPPLDEQEKIVNYLDYKISKIDKLISEKEKLIQLFKEKRSSIITRIVTNGLDDKVQFVKCNLKWLSKMPANWIIRKAKYVFSEVKRVPKDDDKIITAFRDGIVTLRENRREEGFTNALKEIGYQRILKNDLVIHGMDAFAGAIGVSDSDGKGSPVYSVCKPRVTLNIKYFGALIRTIALSGYISSLSRGIRVRSTDFRFSQFKELELVIPPVQEQDEIVKYIDKYTGPINSILTSIEKQIDLLTEYRSSIIYNSIIGNNRDYI